MSDSSIFDWDGRAGRARYLATGFVLLALKHNLDRLVAAMFGYPSSPISYWVFVAPDGGIKALTPDDAMFYVVLLLFAMPFILTGTAMTLQRLRDAGLPLWLVMLFYVPFLNLIFFFILAAIPSQQSVDEARRLGSRIGRVIPHSEFGSAIFGIVLTAILALLETLFSSNGLGKYGWELFAGIPFFLGLNSTMIYAFHRPRSLGKCLLVAVLSIALVGAAFVAFAVEGIICLAMAMPFAIVIAVFGGFTGYVLQKRPDQISRGKRATKKHKKHKISLKKIFASFYAFLWQSLPNGPDCDHRWRHRRTDCRTRPSTIWF